MANEVSLNENRIRTGSRLLDIMLEGGYEKDAITTIYGPAGSGKTVICLLAAMTMSRSGKKVIYVDTEGGFSVERLKQLSDSIKNDFRKILDSIIFLKPINFDEQKKSFEKLKDIMNDRIGLIIVDTIAMLYRIEMGRNEDIHNVNRELANQTSFLTEIARKKNIPILITNQVYSDFDEPGKVNIVGGDILKYGSKCLIELQITPYGNRKLILRKHRNLPEKKEIVFKIVEGGIIGTKDGVSFRLFGSNPKTFLNRYS
jgi:DNA repair protein RadB